MAGAIAAVGAIAGSAATVAAIANATKPDYPNVAAALENTPELSALYGLANATGSLPVLGNSSFVGTIMAPNNGAVETALSYVEANNGTLTPAQQKTLLNYHVIPGLALSSKQLLNATAGERTV